MERSKLAMARMRKHWTLSQAAERIGCDANTLNRWELGKTTPRGYNAQRLCEVYEATPAELDLQIVPATPEIVPSEEGTFSLGEFLPGPFTLPLLAIEAISVSSALWFIMKQQQWQALVTSYYGRVASCEKLQAQLYDEISTMKPHADDENYSISRRQAIGAMIAAPLAAMTSQKPRTTLVAEEFLPQCAASISACWSMLNEGAFTIVEQALPVYLPSLMMYAQKPSKYQKIAAYLASQAYQLSCEIAIDRENFGTALDVGLKSFLYAQLAEDACLQVATLIRQANLYFHREQSLAALTTYQQALPLLHDVTPLLRGRVHAGFAEVFAMRHQRQEALTSMRLGHEHYPMQPENDPAYRYTHFSRYSLYVFGEGQTRLFLGQAREALDSFTYVRESLLGPQAEPLMYVDLAYYQATASMLLNDMEQSSSYLQLAATLAREHNSRLYYNKIFSIYQEMLKRWEHERRVKDLEGLFQPW